MTLFPRLKERAKQLAGTLSGGEQQMVAMGPCQVASRCKLCCWMSRLWFCTDHRATNLDIIQTVHNEGDHLVGRAKLRTGFAKFPIAAM